MTLEITDMALLRFAQAALQDIRTNAEWIRLMSKPTTLRSSPAARGSAVRICGRIAADYRPLLKVAVQKYGAELFRRKKQKGTG